MRRSDRQQDRAFALALMDRCTHGVMAIHTGEDMPYCLPLTFVRVGDDLYFHCARQGRKVELLRRDPRVCVTFVGEDRPFFSDSPASYSTYFQSAIVTGTATEVTDDREKTAALLALCQKVTPDHVGGRKIRGGHRPEPVCHRRLEDPDGGGHRQGQAGEAQGLTHSADNKRAGAKPRFRARPFSRSYRLIWYLRRPPPPGPPVRFCPDRRPSPPAGAAAAGCGARSG